MNRRLRRAASAIDGLVVFALRGLIRGYQLGLSWLVGRQCRFHPSCSHYASEALSRHGSVTGVWLSLRRIARCHPWHPGGPDPVPDGSSTEDARRVAR